MTDPDRKLGEVPDRSEVALWILVGLMVIIAVGGLVYGFSYPSLQAANPPQTVGAAPARIPPGGAL